MHISGFVHSLPLHASDSESRGRRVGLRLRLTGHCDTARRPADCRQGGGDRELQRTLDTHSRYTVTQWRIEQNCHGKKSICKFASIEKVERERRGENIVEPQLICVNLNNFTKTRCVLKLLLHLETLNATQPLK